MDPVTAVTMSDVIDTTVIDVLIDMVKELTELFTIFPVNLIILVGIVGMAFGLIRKAKKAATN